MTRRNRVFGLWAACAAALLFLASAGTASALGFFGLTGGLTLRTLDGVDGASFQSKDGTLTFSDFEVVIDGLAFRTLDLYKVKPTENGFMILAPFGAIFGSTAELSLSYVVAATEGLGLEIDAARVSFFVVGNGAASLTESLYTPPDGELVGELNLLRQGPISHLWGGGSVHDSIGFDPEPVLNIKELIAVDGGGSPHETYSSHGGYGSGASGSDWGRNDDDDWDDDDDDKHRGWKWKGSNKHDDHHHKGKSFVLLPVIKHSFYTVEATVPEPGTGLLLGGGLLIAIGLRPRPRSR